MKTQDMRERFVTQGSEPLFGPPDDLRKYFANEVSKWGKVIREAGIKAD
jgi:tripartite-type tricarboxylate transporter receptor subunit TctC